MGGPIQITFSFLDWGGALCIARQRCITCTFAHWTLHLAILLLHRYLLPPPSTITLQQCTTARCTGHALLPVPPKRSAKCNALVQQDLSIMKLAKVQGSCEMMEMTTERIILQKRKKGFQAREPCIKNAFQEERLIVWPEYTLSFNVYRGLCF